MPAFNGYLTLIGILILCMVFSWQHAGEVKAREEQTGAAWNQWSQHYNRALEDHDPQVVARELSLALEALPGFMDTSGHSFEEDRLERQITSISALTSEQTEELTEFKATISQTTDWVERPSHREAPIFYILSVVLGIIGIVVTIGGIAGFVHMCKSSRPQVKAY